MATPPSQLKKRKVKKHGRAASESPSITRLKGHQKWTPHPHRPQLLVPSGKVNSYPALESINDKTIRSLLTGSGGLELTSQLPPPGGVVNTERKLLYARVSSVDNYDVGEHLPLRSDGILLHPDTMRECDIVVASPVVVRSTFGGENSDSSPNSGLVVCKAWPLMQLPLDVVAVGNMSLDSCGVQEGDYVRICKFQRPSQVPVASEVWVEPRAKLDFPVNGSFQNYLLHMHNGHFVCEGNVVGVQYYGEWRTFRIVQIHPLKNSDELDPLSSSPVKPRPHQLDQRPPDDVINKLSELALDNDSSMQEHGPSRENAEVADSTLSLEEIPVLKITAKSRIVVVDPSTTNHIQNKVEGPSLSSFAGASRQVKLLKELVLFPLQSVSHQGILFPHGVILYGPPGVGKTLLAGALAHESSTGTTAAADDGAGYGHVHSVQLSANELLLGSGGQEEGGEGRMREVFKEARDRCPSLVVIDDLHILCPRYDSGPSENERKLTASLCSQLDSLHRTPPPAHVVVIATTNQIDGMEPSLRRPGRFDKEVEIPVPTASDRREILQVLLERVKNDLTAEQLTQIADSAHGHVGADLYAVSLEAQYLAVHRQLDSKDGDDTSDKGAGERGVACCRGNYEGVTVSYDDVRLALRAVRPSAMREVTIEVPKVYWRDIGGQGEVKERMKEAIEWPLKHPQVFSRLGISPPKGVLLYGPPGCSKTMVARALATESGLNFIAVKGPELFSKWVGDSERAVRQIFTRARAAAPAIVFFDEMDALAVQRKKEGGSSVADRVLAQLLTEMDGVESLRDVLVVAATNRPDMIDKALLRPGRIDRLIYVPLPSDGTRKEIFKIQFRKTPVADDVDIDVLATLTAGYSGAEVVSVCQEAALSAMHEDIQAERVTWKHFEQALKSVKPRTDMTMIQSYEQYNMK